jgi:LPS sulfotransferase NodH
VEKTLNADRESASKVLPGLSSDYTRFAIIGHARTGSNLLLRALRSSPEIEMHGELFAAPNRVIGQGFDKIITHLYGPRPRHFRAVGCKIFYFHLTEPEWSQFYQMREFKIIHILRRNRLRTIISLEIARKTDQWVLTNPEKRLAIEQKRIHLNTQGLIRKLEQIEAWEDLTRQRFKDRDTLEIYYEELVTDFDVIASQVITFVGAKQWDANRVKLEQQNPEPICQLVINFDQVASALANTRWQVCLE